jgi:hypothetical protein
MRLIALIAASLLVARELPAQVVTFGADLTLQPNVTFDCSVWPIPSPFVPGALELVPTQAQTCTWTTISVGPTYTNSLFVPAGNGTVTQVRVKVGPTTGPMQVVVLQALRQPPNPDPGCCQQVGQSDVFTPQANAITTIPVALPVRADQTPDENNIYAFDILGLSILAPGVPIPAFDTGNYSPVGAGDDIDFPASAPNAAIAPKDAFGFALLMNADWIPSTTGPGSPSTGPTTQSAPIQIPNPQAVLQGNNAIIDLTCALAGPCPGRVRLQNGPAPGAIVVQAAIHPAAKTAHLVTYAKKRFKLAGGQQAMIAARLNRQGRKLAQQGSPSVWVNVTFTGSHPVQSISRQVTLTH